MQVVHRASDVHFSGIRMCRYTRVPALSFRFELSRQLEGQHRWESKASIPASSSHRFHADQEAKSNYVVVPEDQEEGFIGFGFICWRNKEKYAKLPVAKALKSKKENGASL